MVSLSDGYTQTVLVGLICFSGPGLWNALTALGAAGSDNQTAASLSNALLYITFGMTGFFGGALFNLFGNKALFFVGGLTYMFYPLSFLIAGIYGADIPIAIVAGCVLGLGATCLWTAQGASVLVYAPEGHEAKYISTFWFILSIGGLAGGLLMCAGNWRNLGEDAGKINMASRLIMLSLMFMGPIISLFFLQPTAMVVKANGEPVIVPPRKSVADEIKLALSGFKDRNMHLMALYSFVSNAWFAYFFNGINSHLFNIRTRGFNSALFWCVQMVGTKLGLYVLDHNSISKRRQAVKYFWVLVIFGNFVFTLGGYLQLGFEGGWDRDNTLESKIDLLNISRGAFPILMICMYSLLDSLIQTYGMWMISALAAGKADKIARYSGFYKSIQSIGGALSWFVDLRGLSYRGQFFMIWALYATALPTTFFAANSLQDTDSDELEELIE